MDIVAKPISNPAKAEEEIRLTRQSLERGIKVVEPFGTININDELGRRGFTLTLLKKGVVPLSSIRLEGIRVTANDQKVHSLLENVGSFVADFHNKGLAHGDLHPGNLGLDMTTGSGESFVLFDLERSHLLEQIKLATKKNIKKNNGMNGEAYTETELEYIKDLAKITAFSVVNNRGFFEEEWVKKAILGGYTSKRDPEKGQFQPQEYEEKFNQYYRRFTRDAEITQYKIQSLRNQVTPS